MIKAIFFDIDGTLVSYNTHQIPQTTIDALHQLKEKGIKIFIATGRGKDGLGIIDDIEFDGYITLNGQYCFTKEQKIYENTIVRSDMIALLDYLKTHEIPCGFVEENHKYFNFRNHLVDEINAITNNDNHPAGNCEGVEDRDIYQIMCFVDEKEGKDILKLMPHCISARWYPTFMDISPKGGTKQLGIDKFLEYYDIDLSQTMAFGDGGNDIDMLKHVRLSVAMGNATYDVKKACDYVTDDVDHDGILKALQQYKIIE